jgi:2,3-bisphosphoglycerate-independent phosphoglycerate mutase
MASSKGKVEKKVLILSADEFQIATLPEQGDIVFRLNLAQMSEALMPELDVAIRISPTEARQIAAALIHKADEIQGKPA